MFMSKVEEKRRSESMYKRGLIIGLFLLGILGISGCGKDNTLGENTVKQSSLDQILQGAGDGKDETDAGKPEQVFNNGGTFVKVGEDIYYIKVTENAFPQNALFGEYRSQIRPGEECTLMRYRQGREPDEVARVLGHSKLAYYDDCFYVGGMGEDYLDRIWEVEKESGEKKLVVEAKMLDIDPETGRYVAYRETEDTRVLAVYEGNREICSVLLQTQEDTHIANACVRGEYLIYWEAVYYPLDEEAAWGSLYACHLPDKATKCLGQIPYSLDWGDAFYPELDQLAVRGQQVFFNIGYYGGSGHFLEQSSVFAADLNREDSITYLSREWMDEEYIYYGLFHEDSLPEVVMTNLQDNKIYLDYETHSLCWAKPAAGAQTEQVPLLSREAFDYVSYEYQLVEVAEYVDGKAYCIINHVTENPSESIGWRMAYTAHQVEFCAIDVEKAEYSLIESQTFQVELDAEHSDYEPFLKGNYSADTSYTFMADDDQGNGDFLYYGTYTIDELIKELFILNSSEVVVSYAFHDLDYDSQDEMILRLENSVPASPRWTGIFSFDYDCPLILEAAYIDGYRSHAILYESGYMITGNTNGAASYSTTVSFFTQGREIVDCFTLRELYGNSVAELIYDLVDPYSVELSYDTEIDEGFRARAYIDDDAVLFSVDGRSENPACAGEEVSILDGLRYAGAMEVSSEEMDALFDLTDYYGDEIGFTYYETRNR